MVVRRDGSEGEGRSREYGSPSLLLPAPCSAARCCRCHSVSPSPSPSSPPSPRTHSFPLSPLSGQLTPFVLARPWPWHSNPTIRGNVVNKGKKPWRGEGGECLHPGPGLTVIQYSFFVGVAAQCFLHVQYCNVELEQQTEKPQQPRSTVSYYCINCTTVYCAYVLLQASQARVNIIEIGSMQTLDLSRQLQLLPACQILFAMS